MPGEFATYGLIITALIYLQVAWGLLLVGFGVVLRNR